jgi:hypothetical protein
MSIRGSHTPPDGFEGIDAALRDLRPQLAEDRLSRVTRRARVAAIGGSVQRKESFVRSRVAILLMLVSGFALSGAGAGLAVSGVVGDNLPADAQYDRVAPGNSGGETTLVAPEQGVKGEQNSGAPKPQKPAAEVAPTEQAEPTQVTRQVSADTSGDELPFTGFAAIPVLLIGVFLLASGFMLRRGNRRAEA